MSGVGDVAGIDSPDDEVFVEPQNPPTPDHTVLLDVNPAVRYPLLLLNMVLCVVGAFMALSGLYTLLETWDGSADDDQETLRKFNIYSWVVTRIELVVTATGLVFFFVSCCGCVGALRENTLLLRIYSVVLTMLIVIGLICGIIVFFMPAHVKKLIQDTLSESLVIHYRDTADSQQFVDAVQRYLQCCGMTSMSYQDWNKNIYFNCSTQNPSQERCSVPHSCCKQNSSGELLSIFCGRKVLNMSGYDAWFRIYIGNCPDAAHRFVREHVMIVGGTCLAVVIVIAFLDLIANSVVEEINIIRRIYAQINELAAQPPSP
ncbi:tetraspanin-33-like [Ixodes scapularis]|uniref:tetraspanin-33-like n=1 Tax=Ixodes scapularis TaxID=6945 RepID=UPI001A9E398C|nr:tetraspanin-33-like [Ixodes scapularis]